MKLSHHHPLFRTKKSALVTCKQNRQRLLIGSNNLMKQIKSLCLSCLTLMWETRQKASPFIPHFPPKGDGI